MSEKVILQNVRLGAFPNLYQARDYKGDGKFSYSGRFHVPKNSEAAKKILDAYQKVATEAWKDKAPMMLQQFKGNELKSFISDGDLFADKEGHSGHYIVRAKRRQGDGRPDVRDRNKQPLQEADGKPYGGCFVNVVLDVWAQTKDNPGMRCKLLGIQFVKDGDAFLGGGSQASEEDYEDLGDGEGAPELGSATGTGGYV